MTCILLSISTFSDVYMNSFEVNITTKHDTKLGRPLMVLTATVVFAFLSLMMPWASAFNTTPNAPSPSTSLNSNLPTTFNTRQVSTQLDASGGLWGEWGLASSSTHYSHFGHWHLNLYWIKGALALFVLVSGYTLFLPTSLQHLLCSLSCIFSTLLSWPCPLS